MSESLQQGSVRRSQRGDGGNISLTNARAPFLAHWVDRTPTRWFYVVAAVAFLLISLGSFAPEIADQSHALGPYTWLIIAHGISLILCSHGSGQGRRADAGAARPRPSTSSSTITRPTNNPRSAPGWRGTRDGPSTSSRHHVPGSMPSRASSPSSPGGN